MHRGQMHHYSITSSARATSVGGTSRPRALAALLRSEPGVGVIEHSGGRPRIDTTYLSLGAVGVCNLIATPAVFVRHNERRADARLFSPAWARTRNIMAS